MRKFVILFLFFIINVICDNADEICTSSEKKMTESYWCWKGIFHWRCNRTVQKTIWTCYYFSHKSSCYVFYEKHTVCGRGKNDVYSFGWNSGCVGTFSNFCHGSGFKTFDNKPSVSKGCSENLLNCL